MTMEIPTGNHKESGERARINEKIEKMRCGLDEKMALLLVCHDAKPLGDMEYVISSPEELEAFRSDMAILEELGLVLHSAESDTHTDDALRDKKVVDVYFAKQKDVLDAVVQNDTHNSDIVFGKAFGFPDTAIQAFENMCKTTEGVSPSTKRTFMWRRELPDDVKQSDVYPYITFGVLSKENWQEEIKTAQKWRDTAKREHPKLHEEYTRWAREEWLHEELA